MNHPSSQGISLIEILIVIIIIGILAGLTYPSYLSYLTKTRRIDGTSALLDLANRMERYYATTFTYATATIGTGNSQTDILSRAESAHKWYGLKIIKQTATSYTLQATPQKSQALDDKKCQSLTINHLGIKSIREGPRGTPTGRANECW